MLSPIDINTLQSSSFMGFPLSLPGVSSGTGTLLPAAAAGTDLLTTGLEASSLLSNPMAGGATQNPTAAYTDTMSGIMNNYMQLMTMLMQLMQANSKNQQNNLNQNGGNNAIDGNNAAVNNGADKVNGGNNNGAVNNADGAATGSAAVDQAKKFLGQNSIDLKGKLPNFTAAGGVTNNCADFVSSCLENAGLLKGHEVNVGHLEESLKKQGYVQVSREQSQPGDVWISDSAGHTELVAEAGGKTLIGSNGSESQKVSEDKYSGTKGGRFYHKSK